MKRVEYDVLTADSLSGLVLIVNKRMTDGWRSLGGVAVSIQDGLNGHDKFYQAMIKKMFVNIPAPKLEKLTDMYDGVNEDDEIIIIDDDTDMLLDDDEEEEINK